MFSGSWILGMAAYLLSVYLQVCGLLTLVSLRF